jgi:hypothetical protein
MEHEFFDFWRDQFPNTPPISFAVRDNHLDRWVRRHALPESKRYADTPEEVAEVLYRANAIGDALFQQQPDCWLVKASYTATLNPKLGSLGLEHAYDLYTPEPEGTKVSVYATRTRWAKGAFNDVLRELADAEIYSLMWVGTATGVVFAPYDGGFDLIFPTANGASMFEAFLPEWRSTHPSGW